MKLSKAQKMFKPMPQFREFETKWVDVLPLIGIECPVCQEGIVEDNSFTSKKGERFQSVKCKKCYTKWVKTKFGDKEAPQTNTTSEILLMEEIQKLHEDHKAINDNLKLIVKLLRREIPVVEDDSVL